MCIIVLFLSHQSAGQIDPSSDTLKYVPVTVYDPKRDAEADIKAAVLEAERTGKNVLLDVGGDWCVWCHTLDLFFHQNRTLLEYRELLFVMVKINFSPGNQNKNVLSRYPTIPGFPHLFVLNSKGKLLHSQGTGELEEGKSYNHDKFFKFLKRWGPTAK